MNDDLISRQAVLDIDFHKLIHTTTKPAEMIRQKIEQLPSVNPQEPTDTWSIKDVADTFKKHGLIVEQEPKTGHWIDVFGGCECSECGCLEAGYSDYCPNCGCRMVEPQESEDKE